MLEDSDLYLNFCSTFGRDDADKIIEAASSHTRFGDPTRTSFGPLYPDEFARWMAYAIGYQCVSRFREEHGIATTEAAMKRWCIDNNVLNRAPDCDFLCLMAGGYDGWHDGESADAFRVQPGAEYPF